MKNLVFLLAVVWLFAACEKECLVEVPPAYDVAKLSAPATAEVGKVVEVECTITYGANDCSSSVPKTGYEVVDVYFSYAPQRCNVESLCFTTFNAESSSLQADYGVAQNDLMYFTCSVPGVYCTRIEVRESLFGAVVAEKMIFTESF